LSSRVKATLRILLHYKSFVAGLVIISFFIGISIYAMVTWPYDKAIEMWNDPSYWRDYPALAKPSWIKYFTGKKEIEGVLVINTERDTRLVSRRTVSVYGGVDRQVVNVTIQFDYDEFPESGYIRLVQVLGVNTTRSVNIGVKIRWIKPNGIVLTLYDGVMVSNDIVVDFPRTTVGEHQVYREFNRVLRSKFNTTLQRDLKPVTILFIDDDTFVNSNQTTVRVLKGTYILQYVYDKPSILQSLEARVVFRGTLYGLLGTDYQGRDLFMGIAWGAPIALLFGLLASVLTTLLTMLIAAIVAWFRGVVDEAVSRVNEIFMVLPFLPFLIMIMLFYGFTIWTLLLIVVALNVIGSGGIKTYRAMFMQIREMPYIEAARAYGAGSWRIIVKYMIPKVLPTIIPSIVLSVPSFVFLEAALAILGISDPRIISWGKILDEAYEKAALFGGAYHWILAPTIALMLLSLAFALMGFTLDRVFNPRLRQI